jgi:hypothetical protein
VTATPDLSPPYARGRESGVGRDLVLIGVDAVVTVAALAGAGRYSAMLANSSSDLNWPAGGWQLTVAEVLTGVAIVAIAVLGAVGTARLWRALSGRTGHARIVVLAMILPGVFVGLQAAGPINSTLTWASNLTRAASGFRVQEQQHAIEQRNAPLQVRSHFPPLPAAVARQLLTTSSLGPGWFSLFRPATRAGQLLPPLAKQGAVKVGGTSLVRAQRSATGWDDSLFLVENVTTFGTAAQARHYAAAAPQQAPASLPATGSDDHTAAFSHGTNAFSLFVMAGTGHAVSRREFEALVRRAVALSGRSAHRAA